MSLRPSAPEFQPILSQPSVVVTVDDSIKKESHVITMPDLGYEFPYTITTMPLPNFNKTTPNKRVWTEMITSASMYLKRY
jgi:hypothetical protein